MNARRTLTKSVIYGWDMRLKVDNGFYKFYPIASHELDLLKAEGFDVVSQEDYFTFPLLAALPAYSIEAIDYSGIIAAVTYSGTPELVLLNNKFVYDLKTRTLKNLANIAGVVDYMESDIIYFNGLPQMGCFMKDKKRLKGFSGYWDLMGSGIITAEALEYYAD